MTGKPYSIHLRTTKSNLSIYYVQFKIPDGTWTNAKSTGIIQDKKNPDKTLKKAEIWATQEFARLAAEKERTELEAQKNLEAEKENTRKLKEIVFGKFAKDFFLWNNEWAKDKRIRGLRLSEKWCLQKQRLVNTYLIPTFKETLLKEIDKHTIKKFRNELYYDRHLSGGTVNHILNSLHQILQYAEENDYIESVPRIDKVSRKPRQETGVLSMDEAKKLFFQTEWDDFMSFAFSLTAAITGARKGELLALQLKNIHQGYIEIAKTWDTELLRLTDKPKNGKTRNIVIPDKLQIQIEKLIDMNPYNTPESFLFFSCHREDRPIDQKVMIKYFYRALKKIGIDEEERRRRKIVTHSHRHFANTILIAGGINIQKIQATIGHLDDRMTEHYFHAQISDMTDIKQIQESIFNKEVT
jgi:integrase